jgi:hypothetical protein
MGESQATRSLSTPTKAEVMLISPQHVWPHLSHHHRQQLLQTIVLICQDLLIPAGISQDQAVDYE